MRALIAPLFALSALLSALPAGGAPEATPYFETSTIAPGFLPRTTPAAVGLDAQRLGALVEGARLANSDALIVLKDGKVVVERYFDQPVGPIACIGITQAVSSLAILKLMDEGRIRSLDEPLTTWFPVWQADPMKARITLRQVLTHTTGLGHPMRGAEPGSQWEDNDASTMLLAGIVKAAAGRPIDDYLQDKLFLPLGIVDWTWKRDQAGNPDTFGGLALRPRDLARIGQLMLDQGRWQGRQVLSIRSVTEATAPAQRLFQHQALLWQLHDLDGRRYFGHDGCLGQYLVVDPATRLVAVRMIREQRADPNNPRDGFDSFYDMFERLAGH